MRSMGSAGANRRAAALDRGLFRVTAVYPDGTTFSRKLNKWSVARQLYSTHVSDDRVVYVLLVVLKSDDNEYMHDNLSFNRPTPQGDQ